MSNVCESCRGEKRILYLLHEGHVLLGDLFSFNLQCCNIRNDSETETQSQVDTTDTSLSHFFLKSIVFIVDTVLKH